MLRSITIAALLLVVAVTSNLVADEANTPLPAAQASADHRTAVEEAWGISAERVPELLRMHVPMLQRGHGLLVVQVDADRPAANNGLVPGDILLEVASQPIARLEDLPQPTVMSSPIVCLRRGTVAMVGPMNRQLGFGSQAARVPHAALPHGGHIPGSFGQGFAIPGVGISSGVSSSSFATGQGSHAVSVSQSGDMISLEISNPALDARPIRFHGTRQQILEQVEQSNLSPAAKTEVRGAL